MLTPGSQAAHLTQSDKRAAGPACTTQTVERAAGSARRTQTVQRAAGPACTTQVGKRAAGPARTLDLVWTGIAAADDRRLGGLHSDDLQAAFLLLQVLARPRDGATGANACRERDRQAGGWAGRVVGALAEDRTQLLCTSCTSGQTIRRPSQNLTQL